jgi:hypothetical protein
MAEAVFAVHPPTEVQHQLRKGAFEELDVAFAMQCLFGAVQEYRSPGMYRRIDVTEVLLIGRDLPGRMQEKLIQHQIELFFGKVSVDRG